MLTIYGMGALMDRAPETNWGSVEGSAQRPQADIFANATLAEATLTQRDRELFELLELGSNHAWVTPHLQSAFNQLMRPGTISEHGPRVFIDWIEHLVRFVPAYDTAWGTPSAYDQAGCSRPLTALYVVARRADFWSKRLKAASSPAINMEAFSPDPVELFFDSSRQWGETEFIARRDEIEKFRMDINRPLINQLEMLTRVVAIVIPPLKQFMADYDAWEVQLPKTQ